MESIKHDPIWETIRQSWFYINQGLQNTIVVILIGAYPNIGGNPNHQFPPFINEMLGQNPELNFVIMNFDSAYGYADQTTFQAVQFLQPMNYHNVVSGYPDGLENLGIDFLKEHRWYVFSNNLAYHISPRNVSHELRLEMIKHYYLANLPLIFLDFTGYRDVNYYAINSNKIYYPEGNCMADVVNDLIYHPLLFKNNNEYYFQELEIPVPDIINNCVSEYQQIQAGKSTQHLNYYNRLLEYQLQRWYEIYKAYRQWNNYLLGKNVRLQKSQRNTAYFQQWWQDLAIRLNYQENIARLDYEWSQSGCDYLEDFIDDQIYHVAIVANQFLNFLNSRSFDIDNFDQVLEDVSQAKTANQLPAVIQLLCQKIKNN